MSIDSLEENNIEEAVYFFPKKEHSFITIMEKTYLNLLQGKVKIDQLQRIEKKISKQIRYKVSRELKSFFYLKTPKGYYPSEHEIIWMHFLLSWGYSLQKDYEAAQVEAKKATILLRSDFDGRGHFDDANLRIMLAMIWAMSGNWEEAQIDFRKAAKLNKSLTWARYLANLDKKPKNVFIILGGVGPEVFWKSGNNVDFTLQGKKSKLKYFYRSPDARYWYKRHLMRNNWITDFVDDIQFYNKAVATTALTTVRIAAVTTLGVVVIVSGVGVGAGIFYLGVKVGSGEVAGAGLIAGGAIIVKGADIISDGVKKSTRDHNKILDPSKTYRFVRYLPEYSWLSWGKTDKTNAQILKTGQNFIYPLKFHKFEHANQTVYIGFNSD
jgi:tetratricopeptide (TPR) repeat protein